MSVHSWISDRFSWPSSREIAAIGLFWLLLLGVGFVLGNPGPVPHFTGGCGITPGGEAALETASPLTDYDPDDPSIQDPDEDNLPTAVERRYGSDPERKTVFVYLLYGDGQRALHTDEKLCIQRRWADMNVSNPGNETGIELFFRKEDRIDRNASFKKGDGYPSDYRPYLGNHSPARCVDRVVIAADSRTENLYGYAPIPGYASFVDIQGTDGPTYVVSHELLHNTVGEIEDGVDGGRHAHSGILKNGSYTWGLTPNVSQKLNESGFPTPAKTVYGSCLDRHGYGRE